MTDSRPVSTTRQRLPSAGPEPSRSEVVAGGEVETVRASSARGSCASSPIAMPQRSRAGRLVLISPSKSGLASDLPGLPAARVLSVESEEDDHTIRAWVHRDEPSARDRARDCRRVGSVYRVGRVGSALRFSEISPTDYNLGKAGNRYDVLGGGVLYAATDVRTCELVGNYKNGGKEYRPQGEPELMFRTSGTGFGPPLSVHVFDAV